jgi:hypothetical protein
MSANSWSGRGKQIGHMLFRAADLACYPVILISLLVTNGTKVTAFCSIDEVGPPRVQLVMSKWMTCPPPRNEHSYSQVPQLEFTFNHTRKIVDMEGEVSGLYGPGAQIAWLLTILSVMATLIFFKGSNENNIGSKFRINADVIASVLYAIFASADLLHKSFFPKESFRLEFDAASRTVWNAIVLLLAILAPFRASKRAIEPWQAAFYFTLWVCFLSYLLSRKWLLFDVNEFSARQKSSPKPEFISMFKIWIREPEAIFRLLLSIPMLLYFSFASRLKSIVWKPIVMMGFILFCTVVFDVLLEFHNTIYTYLTSDQRPRFWPKGLLYTSLQHIIHPEYFPKHLRKTIPVTVYPLTDLDQMAALVTTVIVLGWQWKIWRWPITLAVKVKEALTSRISPGRPPAEDPLIDLESLSSRRTGVEEEV